MRECGFAVCRDRQGNVITGKTVCGSRSHIYIPMKCPPGTKLAALHHTHPFGSLEPSAQDLKVARKHGIAVCVEARGKIRCYR